MRYEAKKDPRACLLKGCERLEPCDADPCELVLRRRVFGTTDAGAEAGAHFAGQVAAALETAAVLQFAERVEPGES